MSVTTAVRGRAAAKGGGMGAAIAASQSSMKKTQAQYRSYNAEISQFASKTRGKDGEQAARVGDEIKHSNALAGFLLGAIVAAALAVAVVGTGGLAAAVIVGVAVTAGSMGGQALGAKIPGSVTGAIGTGSDDVKTNTKPAARAAVPPPPPPGWFQRLMHKSWLGAMASTIVGGAVGAWNGGFAGAASAAVSAAGNYMDQEDLLSEEEEQKKYDDALAEAGDSANLDTAICSKENVPPRIGQGAETVFINAQPAVRKGDQVECGAKISQGSPNVFIGGPQGTTLEIDDEIPLWADILTMLIPPGAGLVKFGTQFVKIMVKGGFRNALRFASVKALGRGAITCSKGFKGVRGFVCKFLGDPVNPQNGSVVDERTDINLPGLIPLTFTRHYSSVGHHQGMLGPSWMDSWSERLEIQGEETWYRRQDGSAVIFHTPFEEGIAEHLIFNNLQLIKKGGSHEIYDLKSRTSLHFDQKFGSTLRLTKVMDAHNHWQKFHWSAEEKLLEIHDSADQKLRLAHEAQSITVYHRYKSTETKVVTYSFDPSGRLEQVDSLQEGKFFYGYDDHNRMAWWGDTRAVLAKFVYDSEGRCTAVKSADGYYDCRFEYQPEARRTLYHTKDGTSIFEFDEKGNVISETDPLGNQKQTLLDYSENVVAEIDPLGRKTEFTYDHLNNLASVTTPDGQTTGFKYKEFDLDQVTDPAGRTVQYSYNEQGDIVHLETSADHFVSVLHDDKGLPERILDQAGRKTRLGYDERGLLTSQIDPLGHKTKSEYNALGTQTALIAADGSRTRFTAKQGAGNPKANITQIELPGGETTHLRYDSEGLLSRHTDGEGRETNYRYGAFDLLQEVRQPGGEKLAFHYGNDERLERVINAAGEQYRYAYDRAGNIVEETDFAGHKTKYTYDACGNLTAKTAPDRTKTHHQYDVMDRLVLTEVYDGAPDLDQKPTRGTFVRYAYDDLGQIASIENQHARIDYRYDDLGRLVSENQNGHEITYEYDPDTGLLARRTTPSGQSAAYEWDALDQLKAFQVDEHGKIEFTHNKLGQETSRSSDRGFAETRSYTASGLLREQWAGRYTGEKGKIAKVMDFTQQGVVHQQSARHYSWNKAFNLTGIKDERWGHSAFAYNPNGQVTEAVHGGLKAGDRQAVRQETFAYDKRQNIASQHKIMQQWVEPGQAKETPFGGEHFYRKGGLVENFITAPHTRVKYVYDACGRVTEKTEYRKGFRPKTTRLVWNGLNQLTKVMDPDGQEVSYTYDPLGRRISKTIKTAPNKFNPLKSQTFVWDGIHLAEEVKTYADGTPAETICWHFEPDAAAPLAKQQNGQFYHIVTDHLGSPREMLTEDGKLAWAAEKQLWGQTNQLWPIAANDQAPKNPTCEIGFPGQYGDPETGFSYNFYRYYDPDTGQYLSPDPIGLAGGERPQGYVLDPNGWMDILGLKKCWKGFQAAAQASLKNSDKAFITAGKKLRHTMTAGNKRILDAFIRSPQKLETAVEMKYVAGAFKNSFYNPKFFSKSATANEIAGYFQKHLVNQLDDLAKNFDDVVYMSNNKEILKYVDQLVAQNGYKNVVTQFFKY